MSLFNDEQLKEIINLVKQKKVQSVQLAEVTKEIYEQMKTSWGLNSPYYNSDNVGELSRFATTYFEGEGNTGVLNRLGNITKASTELERDIVDNLQSARGSVNKLTLGDKSFSSKVKAGIREGTIGSRYHNGGSGTKVEFSNVGSMTGSSSLINTGGGYGDIRVTNAFQQGDIQQANIEGLGSWVNCVSSMGNWYQNNIHTYQGTSGSKIGRRRKAYSCDLLNGGTVYDDCSAFVWACLQFFGIQPGKITTAGMQPGSKFDKTLQSSGFQYIPYSKDKLLIGDIICGGPKTHTEIYADDGKSWSWGSIHDGVNGHQGMPCKFASSISYKHIWRYVGPGRVIPSDFSYCVFGSGDIEDSGDLDNGTFSSISTFLSNLWDSTITYTEKAANGVVRTFVGTENYIKRVTDDRSPLSSHTIKPWDTLSSSTQAALGKYYGYGSAGPGSGGFAPSTSFSGGGLDYVKARMTDGNSLNSKTQRILSTLFTSDGKLAIDTEGLNPVLKESLEKIQSQLQEQTDLNKSELELNASIADSEMAITDANTHTTLQAIRGLTTRNINYAPSANSNI